MSDPIADALTASIKGSIENALRLVMVLGVPPDAAQAALEHALATIAIGTFQARMQQQPGMLARVTAREACDEMANMVVDDPPRREHSDDT